MEIQVTLVEIEQLKKLSQITVFLYFFNILTHR